MVFSIYGSSSSFYLPLDSDQGVTSFYKNENAALFTAPTSVVCRGNQDNACSTMSPGEVQPFGNNSHGTVVVDAVRQDFQPVAHLSSNGYYGYVPPQPQPPKMMSTPATAAVNAACDIQLEDAAMDCGEMENFQQLQHNQHHRKRKEYGEEAMASKRRKTWLEGEEQQQQAGFPQSFGWNQLPYAHHQQMDCHVEDTPMTTTIIGSCNGAFAQAQPASPIPVATVTPIQVQPPKNYSLVDGHSGSGRRDLLGRWNIAMPTSRPAGTGCSTVSQLSEKLHSHQQTHTGGGGQELEDLFVSLHGSGFFLAG